MLLHYLLGRLAHSSPTVNEIEKKFAPSAAIINLVRSSAKRERLISFRDRYFENSRFALTTRDVWLRQRDNTFELKYPMRSGANKPDSTIDFYHESSDWHTIAREVRSLCGVHLALPHPDTAGTSPSHAESWLNSNGLFVFADILTTRTRFDVEVPAAGGGHFHTVRVDIDAVEFQPLTTTSEPAASHDPGRFSYAVGEVELDSAAGNVSSTQAMHDVFSALGISPASRRGKVLEYLIRFNDRHYAALTASGLVAAKMG